MQVPSITAKVGSSALESRGAYASTVPDSPKFSSGDYVSSSSHGYGHKGGQLYAEKVSDYPVIDRRQYSERQSSYLGRDLQSEPTGRYADSVSFAHQHQVLCSHQFIYIFKFFFLLHLFFFLVVSLFPLSFELCFVFA